MVFDTIDSLDCESREYLSVEQLRLETLLERKLTSLEKESLLFFCNNLVKFRQKFNVTLEERFNYAQSEADYFKGLDDFVSYSNYLYVADIYFQALDCALNRTENISFKNKKNSKKKNKS